MQWPSAPQAVSPAQTVGSVSALQLAMQAPPEHTLELATAVLLVEVMRADARMSDVERHAVIEALRALADRYQTLWNLRQADVEELTKAGRLGRPLAERVRDALKA